MVPHNRPMRRDVLRLREIDATQVALVGGKAAGLAELSRIEGIRVPDGFCVTTDAFRHAVATAPSLDALLARLASLPPDDRAAIRALSAEIRATIEALDVPEELAAAIAGALAELGDPGAWAVRSSATAEDLPSASFAGQHDSYLGLVGLASILEHVRRCWGSLFSERAVTYRLRQGIDAGTAAMAVVVQRMVQAQAAGVLFTADPASGNRRASVIEAIPGLGEALVSGRVNPEVYRVGDGEETEPHRPGVLTDEQVTRLAALGRRIEAHFGRPQDIEWCLADGELWFVQSRPITTLFPIPAAKDPERHVYVSVGHQQMMTDAMRPLGLSFWQMTTPRPMAEAGGRLFVDVTPILASSASRPGFLEMAGRSDPLMRDALETVLQRGDVVPPDADAPAWSPPAAGPDPIETDPAIVSELIERTQTSIATAEREIAMLSGPALLDFIRDDMQELRRVLFDSRSHQAIMAGMEATWWLNDQLEAWLGERNAADALSQSAPHNVTSEMGLALLDVADTIRPHPAVVAYLEQGPDDGFLGELPGYEGGSEARDAIRGWLQRYGMRAIGEIDITRPRWSERPGMLLPTLLGHVRNFKPGEAARRIERGRRRASAKETELLGRLHALPDGDAKATETQRMIERLRTFIGYREYPKYGMVSRYFVYKQALLGEADRLVRAGVLRAPDDIFYLTFEELGAVVRSGRADEELIRRRSDELTAYQALVPPRVLTADGEMINGAYRRDDLPPGAMAGLAVSSGTVEGRARVISDIAEAQLEPGDILVTAYTDPSWTPLFVGIAGLVTEVGGLMTHGSVIAREYGLPAVVGVTDATRLIRDGQRIRVDGSEGYVTVMPETPAARR
jgi:pyruvate,water dikinase